jgi:1-deoxy-D-xylulose-5-phosphate synthase
MSINRNVGGLSRHLENLRISQKYIRIKSRIDTLLLKLPIMGHFLYNLAQLVKRTARHLLQRQGVFFEQLGFRYYGPIDGHDLPSLRNHLRALQELHGPILLHIVTQKGKGYRYAEESPDLYHGVAPFIIENGVSSSGTLPAAGLPHSFSDAFGQHMNALARHNPRLCAISAAMTAGTGLTEFAENYPARFFDVGIAEQHAVTLAAGLAAGGMKPVVALYSTFLQRAYDQVLHDICLQDLPVVLAIDRAGIVGEDGETHQGIYDLGLLLPLPHLEIFCPPDYAALADILDESMTAVHPMVIRYPRGREWPLPLPIHSADAGKDWRSIRVLQAGLDVTIAALGTMSGPAMQAADILAGQDIAAEVLLITCAKPLDLETLAQSVRKTGRLIFVEEGLQRGGLGQAALPDLLMAVPGFRFRFLGIADRPLTHGKREQLLAEQQLTPETIARQASQLFHGNPNC